MSNPQEIIRQLRLEPLPNEGGFYRQTWRSRAQLPNGRATGTAIYFLLTRADFSAFHTVDADEIWHHYAGDPVEHVQLESASRITLTHIGQDLNRGEVPQLLVLANIWQAARIVPTGTHGWSLLGCTMSPGWDESGFRLGSRDTLIADYPDQFAYIVSLTRG